MYLTLIESRVRLGVVMGKRKRFHGQDHALATEGANVQELRWYQRAGSIFSVSIFSFTFVVSVSLICFTIMFFFTDVIGSSMMMTFNPDYVVNGIIGNSTDAAVVNRHRNARRGDVIIVRDPRENENGLFVKRMIAMNGDKVYFSRRQFPLDDSGNQITVGNGLIHYFVIEVNGVEIDESYLDPYWGMNVTYGYIWQWTRPNRASNQRGPYGYFIRYVQERARYEIHVPRGYMFYMGDNRGGSGIPSSIYLKSRDSAREFGPQPMNRDFVGVVIDIVSDNQSLPAWVWGRFVWFITFRWI